MRHDYSTSKTVSNNAARKGSKFGVGGNAFKRIVVLLATLFIVAAIAVFALDGYNQDAGYDFANNTYSYEVGASCDGYCCTVHPTYSYEEALINDAPQEGARYDDTQHNYVGDVPWYDGHYQGSNDNWYAGSTNGHSGPFDWALPVCETHWNGIPVDAEEMRQAQERVAQEMQELSDHIRYIADNHLHLGNTGYQETTTRTPCYEEGGFCICLEGESSCTQYACFCPLFIGIEPSSLATVTTWDGEGQFWEAFTNPAITHIQINASTLQIPVSLPSPHHVNGPILDRSLTITGVAFDIGGFTTIVHNNSNTLNGQRHFHLIGAGTTLTLNGIRLNGNVDTPLRTSTIQRGGVNVNEGAHLVMNNNSQIFNSRRNNGAAVTVHGGTGNVRSRLTMNSGSSIHTNTTPYTAYPVQASPALRSGGGVAIAAGGRFYMNGTATIHNNVAETGAGVSIFFNDGVHPSHFEMRDGTIFNNRSYTTVSGRGGGGVELGGGGTFTMRGGTIRNNFTYNSGGGVNIFDGGFNLLNGLIAYNSTAAPHVSYRGNPFGGNGGGVATNGSTATVDIHGPGTYGPGGIIRDNVAGGAAGGILVYLGTVNMHGGVIRENTAHNFGGGAVVYGQTQFPYDGATFNMSGGLIAYNGFLMPHPYHAFTGTNISTPRGGGVEVGRFNGLFNMSGNAVIRNNQVTARTVGAIPDGNGGGGGVSVMQGASFNMTNNAQVHNNTAVNGAGVQVYGVEFRSTTGAGNFGRRSSATMGDGSRIHNNVANVTTGIGGGVRVSRGGTFTTSANLSSVIPQIHDNQALDGAGVHVAGRSAGLGGIVAGTTHDLASSFTMNGGILFLNIASRHGGGLFVGGEDISTTRRNDVVLTTGPAGTGAVIDENTAQQSGGGIYIDINGRVDLRINTIIDNNTANATGNRDVDGGGGGIFVVGSPTATAATNNIRGFLHVDPSVGTSRVNIINNSAPNGMGGGIFSQRHRDYPAAMLTTDYNNLSLVNANIYFNGNTASRLAIPPTSPNNGVPASSWNNVSPNTAPASSHPINNYDINYIHPDMFFQFTKTNHELYNPTPFIQVLQGAEFQLQRWSGTAWVNVGANVTSTTSGVVNFNTANQALLPNTQYRIRELTAPTGFVRPPAPNADGNWTFTTDAFGRVPGLNGASGTSASITTPAGVPAFVLNPPGRTGWFVGNNPVPTRLSFIKTDHRLYNATPAVHPFSGATFVLERQSGSTWTHVQTVTTTANGQVNFTIDLTRSASYRVRETANPDGWVLPTGSWTFVTDYRGGIMGGIPVATGNNPAFVNNPTATNLGLHVGNNPTPTRLSFIKTDHRLYNPTRAVHPFSGATFVLERQSGVTWTHVQTVTTTANGQVNFTTDLTRSANYRVRETANPDGWVLPTGSWTFSTDYRGRINAMPAATGNNPAFVNNPTATNLGWHVGNNPTPTRLSFIKTDNRLYNPTPAVHPFSGATFVLERQSGVTWTHVQTITTTANGQVNFTTDLTRSANYRVRETANPTGWILPTGSWTFSTDYRGRINAMPAATGDNPAFVNNPTATNLGWHVGNMPDLVPTRLSFIKTNHHIYNDIGLIQPLANATFVLERQDGANWTTVETITTTSNGHVNFTDYLTPSANYRIRETANPDGWVLPTGSWTFSTDIRGAISTNEGIPLATGNNPAFIYNPRAGHTGLHVGNMPTPTRLSFTKTDHRLYNNPREVHPFLVTGGATFILERLSPINWSFYEVETVTSDPITGRVDFTDDLTPFAVYRVREIANPDGWILPTGYWEFLTDYRGAITGGIPVAHDGNPAFVLNPTDEHTGLFVGNMPVPGFEFIKTDMLLYGTSPTINPQPGAVFELVLFNPGPIFDWEYVGTSFPSGADGRVIFTAALAPNNTYRLREVTAPSGFEEPQANWLWTLTTDATGNITAAGIVAYDAVATPNLPAFVLNPTSENPGWHVGNRPLSTTFEFIKTDHLLYAPSPQVVALPGAEFLLERYDDDDDEWIYVDTATSGSNGEVTLSVTFTANGVYRLQEITPPTGHNHPPGYWIISINAAGNIDDIAFVANYALVGHVGDHFRFIYDPTEEDDGWHVGNIPTRYWPIIKTNWGIYSDEPHAYRGGAVFTLVVYNGTGLPGDNVIVAPNMIGDASEGYAWSYVGTRISCAYGTPMMFPMMPGRVYQLIEAVPPPGYRAPHGQWRIRVEAYPDMPAGQRLIRQSIGDAPDMLRIYDNGYAYYIGNRLDFDLPLTGTFITSSWFIAAGFATIAAAMVIAMAAFAAKKRQGQSISYRNPKQPGLL